MQPCRVDLHFDHQWFSTRLSAMEAIADTRTAALDARVAAAKRNLREAQELALLDVRSNVAFTESVGPARWRVLACRWLAKRLLRIVYRLLEVD